VGGDFYDVFSVGRRWRFAIGDVCGTGPEAAALAGLVRHALRASGIQTRDPVAMLRTANALLREQGSPDDERFCTVCCAILRPRDAVRVTIACAGHPPPIVLRADGRVEELACRGGALGISPDVTFEPQRISLRTGDRIILYTDGLTEARDDRGGFFGEECLWPLLDTLGDQGAGAVAAALLARVREFTAGRLRDDLALLVAGVLDTGVAGSRRR
jgi:sigma-B regulation protein RsbU (phosphoserine phosphatase)